MANDAPTLVITEGQVVTPSVHDAKLLGVMLLESNRVRALLGLTDGSQVSLLFSGVERLRMDDFRQGNIVLDVSVLSGEAVSANDIAYAYGIDQEPQRTTFLKKMLEEVRAKNLISVTLNPSFGAGFTCLCSNVFAEAPAAS